MIKLDRILKSTAITLPKKFYLVKAMVFPVVMYGCDNWIIKKLRKDKSIILNCGVGEDSDCKEMPPVHSEGDQS